MVILYFYSCTLQERFLLRIIGVGCFAGVKLRKNNEIAMFLEQKMLPT